MNNLSEALKYLDRGYPVIPIRPDKKPFIKWQEFQKRQSTSDEVRQWWDKWPNAMIGTVTGEISKLFIVDCDTPEAYQKVQEYIPDSLDIPTVDTPRGGKHLWFHSDSPISGTAGVMPGLDIRGQGNYIIAPPSANGEGKRYVWMPELSLDDIEPPSVPEPLYKYISLYTYRERNTCNATAGKMFEDGRRDNDLFHTANVLTKGGMPAEEIAQVLERLILSWGEKPDSKWIADKIESAKKRDSRRSGDVTKAIEEWISVTDGNFSVTDCYKALQSVTDSQQATFRVILHRLSKQGIIEKHGQKDGIYRRIDREIEFMDFANADIENTVDLHLPLGLHAKTSIYPKGVIVGAGVSGMGKTLFAFNTIAENRGRFPIFYFNSEMGPEALKKKLSHFPIPMSEWVQSMKVIDQWDFNNIADKIQPDAFNVIDYLEPDGDKPYNIHSVISAIIRRLNKGTALIMIQKKPGATMGTGGIYSIKAATLAFSLDWGRLEIVKNRFRESDAMPLLNKINFEVHQGYKFVNQGGWYK